MFLRSWRSPTAPPVVADETLGQMSSSHYSLSEH